MFTFTASHCIRSILSSALAERSCRRPHALLAALPIAVGARVERAFDGSSALSTLNTLALAKLLGWSQVIYLEKLYLQHSQKIGE